MVRFYVENFLVVILVLGRMKLAKKRRLFETVCQDPVQSAAEIIEEVL